MDGRGQWGYGTLWSTRFGVRSDISGSNDAQFRFSSPFAFDSIWVRIPIIIDSLTICVIRDTSRHIVWPGDTNNDGIVNQIDLLPMGVFWKYAGPKRPNASLSWNGQLCPVWSPDERATYADATGDGVINAGEITAIGLNWGKQHQVAKLMAYELDSIHLEGSLESLIQQDEVSGVWILRIKVVNVEDLFGISWEICYPAQNADILSVELGTYFNKDVLSYFHDDHKRGLLGIAECLRGNQQTSNGSGLLSVIHFQVDSDIVECFTDQVYVQNIYAINSDGERLIFPITTIDSHTLQVERPKEFRLEQNYPNPFNNSTRIRYLIPKVSEVKLDVFDISGRLVKILEMGKKEAGVYEVIWNGTDREEREVGGGVYFLRIEAGKFVQVKKCLLIQ